MLGTIIIPPIANAVSFEKLAVLGGFQNLSLFFCPQFILFYSKHKKLAAQEKSRYLCGKHK